MKNLLLMFTTLFVFGFNTKAQIVNIPDANFKAYLVGNSSINSNGDTEIQASEANAFNGTINCPNLNISDLTGIEAFTSLTKLNCYANNLSSIDVSNNTALTQLWCHDNQLTSLDVSNNTGLTKLYCYTNNLSSLNINNNTALTHLYCYENSLINLELNNHTSLTKLWCNVNQLNSLDVSNTPALTEIRCDNNQLNYLNVANGNNTNIISANFHADNNPNLTCIQVDNSTYSANNWINIDVQSYFSITACPCLVYIPDPNFKAYLVGNSSINTNGDSEIQCTEATAFTGQINCSSLNVSDLTGIEHFSNITDLRLNNNQVTNLDLSNNTNLTNLECLNNQLSSLDLTQNVNLTRVVCRINFISSIDLTQNIAMVHFYCQDNQITALDLSNNLNLERLYCQGNQITNLDLSLNSNIDRIFCNDNLISSLNVANGNNLNISDTYFDASNNPNLNCITVDDVTYSTNNWTNIDVSVNFSSNCNIVFVNSISVQGQGGVSTITTTAGTLQMEANVLPANASDNTYTWSIANGTGEATIDANGLVTAIADGTVIVTATANDGSGVTGDETITISNQSSSITNYGNEKLTIYPNPSNGTFTINVPKEQLGSIIQITNTLGQLIYSQKIEFLSTVIELPLNVKGIYLIQIPTVGLTKKIIIK